MSVICTPNDQAVAATIQDAVKNMTCATGSSGRRKKTKPKTSCMAKATNMAAQSLVTMASSG